MNTWLIYRKEDADRNQAFINWFCVEANKLDLHLELVYHHEIDYGIKNGQLFINRKRDENLPDFVIMRAIDVMLSKQFEGLGIRVFNHSKVAEIANDKAKTHQLFALYDVPMMDTQFVAKESLLKKDFQYPLVIKEVKGRGGNEVYKMDSNEGLRELSLALKGDYYAVQALAIPGKDLRVYVVGRKIIKAVLRQSKMDFRSNFTLGGDVQLYELSREEETLIYKIIEILPVDMVGIDFVFSHDNQLLLNEIEDVVGCRSLTTLTPVNIVQIYLTYILDNIREHRE